jgi:regulatory protein
MGRITALHVSKGRGHRVNVFLDGKFAFSLGAKVVSREGLQPEQELSANQIETLVKTDRYERGLATAIRYLAYRPHSNAELQERLQQRGFDTETQDIVISRLKQQGLLNDTEFAEYWTDNRQSFSPRSRRLTRFELERKGVDREIIDHTVSAIDDESSAYRAAVSHAATLLRYDHDNHDRFFRRLGSYLQRRGFDHDVIRRTVENLWANRESLNNEVQAGLGRST